MVCGQAMFLGNPGQFSVGTKVNTFQIDHLVGLFSFRRIGGIMIN